MEKIRFVCICKRDFLNRVAVLMLISMKYEAMAKSQCKNKQNSSVTHTKIMAMSLSFDVSLYCTWGTIFLTFRIWRLELREYFEIDIMSPITRSYGLKTESFGLISMLFIGAKWYVEKPIDVPIFSALIPYHQRSNEQLIKLPFYFHTWSMCRRKNARFWIEATPSKCVI